IAGIGDLLNSHLRRRTIRGPIHPMDKATIVSIYPRIVPWKNPTVVPGEYLIPSGSLENPTIFIIGPSSWWKDVGLDQPLVEMPQNSMIMAKSVIDDYSTSIQEFTPDARPGLFFVPGCKYEADQVTPSEILTKSWILKEYKHLIDQAKARQANWFNALINRGDIDWARTNGNPNSVSDLMRVAANTLGIKDKPWMQNFKTVELRPCIACGNLVNYSFPVCQHCHHVINPEAYKKLNLVKAS